MSKIKTYLHNLFDKGEIERSQGAQLVDCIDFWGKPTKAPQDHTVRIYDAEAMLNHLIKMYKDYESYIDMNNALAKTGKNTSAFVYHDTIQILCKHLAVLDFLQSLVVLDTNTNNGAIEYIAYRYMLAQNLKTEKVAIEAVNDLNKALDYLDREGDFGANEGANEYIKDAYIGFVFQRETLCEDLLNCYQIYKLVDPKVDNIIVDEGRVDTVKNTVQNVLKRDILPKPDADIEIYDKLNM